MLRPIIYKEWIKTKWCAVVSLSIMLLFTVYAFLVADRAVELRGAGHIWEVMVLRDAVFVDILKYVPLLIGISMGFFQYMPEIYRKSFKLTLHLPCSSFSLIMAMILYGTAVLTACFTVSISVMAVCFSELFPVELTERILLTSLPWFVAGVAAYVFTAWIVLEPAWKMRVVNAVVSVLLLRLFFMGPAPEAYNSFIMWLVVFVALSVSLVWLSVVRFKDGVQD